MSSTKKKTVFGSSIPEWKPHNYQGRAVKFLLEHAGAGLFLDPGLGKTSISLSALKILKLKRVSNITLVIAPLRVCYSVWPEEARKWKNFRELNVKVLHGKDKEDTLQNAEEGDILCINPEGLEWLFGVTKVKGRGGKTKVIIDAKRMRFVFDKLGITDLVIDESTKFKHSNNIRFKTLKQVLYKFKRRWILTGTPAPNGLMDLFAQMFIVDLGRSLGEYITHYRKRFFQSVGFGGFTYVPLPGSEKEIYKILKSSVLRLDGKDYLTLPEVVDNVIRFDLPDKARTLYDQLENDFVGDLDAGRIVTALNAGSAMMKCAQVANGGLYRQKDPLVAAKRGKNAKWDLIHNGKDEIAEELVAEMNGQPVMIAYQFDHDLERLLTIFGKDTPYIGGGVTPKRGKELERLWNLGKIPVLLVQPDSAAHGLNLQHASTEEVGHMIWYSLTYDYENYDQLIRRIVRQGSKHKRVIVHHIVARDTVDEAKLNALRRKTRGQNDLLDALRVYVRSRPRYATKAGRGQVGQAGQGAAVGPSRGAGRAGRGRGGGQAASRALGSAGRTAGRAKQGPGGRR